MSESKWYIGYRTDRCASLQVFRSHRGPTLISHGEFYLACIGPFETKQEAQTEADRLTTEGAPIPQPTTP